MGKQAIWMTASLAAAAMLLTACGTTKGDCTEHNGVIVCGDFGEAIFEARVTHLPGDVSWPPVAIGNKGIVLTRGTDLVQVDRSGAIVRLARFDNEVTATSMGPNGLIFVAGRDGTKGVVKAFEDGPSQGTVHWSKALPAPSMGVPPSVGAGRIYVATGSMGASPALHEIETASGKLIRTRPGASPVAVMLDGTLRYVESVGQGRAARSGGPVFSRLTAETATGEAMWSTEVPAGIIDFAPGPDSETYLVTGNRQLVRVSASGNVQWTFTPDCQGCDVAAAPTVTRDAIYFPVWEAPPAMAMGPDGQPIDPLYTLSREGKLLWVYDGFELKNSEFASNVGLFGMADLETETVKHHPSGRPVVTSTGASYVSTDGAVVSLDPNGREIGRALWDVHAGEVTEDLGSGTSFTWINPGVTPSPVLATDGTLYVWDGSTVRGFATGHKVAESAWIAPFGGPDNAGRID